MLFLKVVALLLRSVDGTGWDWMGLDGTGWDWMGLVRNENYESV